MADPNRSMLESVVRLLTPILDQVVFVGGSTTGLLLTDPAAAGIRPTKDVDTIVNTSYAEYEALSERLKELGLSEDTTEGAPLCRWRYNDIVIDVMPIDEKVLGFTNRWYQAAVQSADTVSDRCRSAHPNGETACISSPRNWRRFMDAALTISP